jgi:iron complex outermembrane recepter protein
MHLTNSPALVLKMLMSGVALSALTTAMPAFAQATDPNQAMAPDTRPPLPGEEDDEAEQEAAEDDKQIVVTGTSIRGVAPVGANVVGIDQTDIQTSGTTDSNQLLGTLPQSNFFLGEGVTSNNPQGVGRIPIIRPRLRDLGNNQTSGSTTLVLMDGKRIVPAGIEQSQVDAGIVPPGMLDRVEVIFDGVSAVYGSDAVGGVINYITRKRFDDTKADFQYTVGDDYFAIGANATTGVTWPTGGVGITYSFGKNNAPLRRDRDFAIPRNYLEGGRLTGLTCEGYSHVTIGSGAALRRFVVTPGSTGFAERTNFCIDGAFNSHVPEQERHSGFLTFSQDITDTIKFDATAFYTNRDFRQIFGPFTSTATIRPTNPYFRPIPGVPAASQATQSVAFSYGPIFGLDAFDINTTTEVWQVSPELSAELGTWEVRGSVVYGKSRVTVMQATLDTALQSAAINGTTFQTALNPYDIAATQNLGIFAPFIWDSERTGKHDYTQARVVADGPLFTLPAGEVRAALGGEWNKTTFHRRTTNTTTRQVGPFASASTQSKAVFAEIIAPIFSDLNAIPAFAELTLSASGRWDEYEFYGDTFNPKVALTWRPIDWVTLRGNWSTSFRAPNSVDRLGASANSLGCQGTSLVVGCATATPPEDLTTFGFPPPAPANNYAYLFLTGSKDDMVPETSENWSIGADIRPPFISGLSVSGTYYSIVFENTIAAPTGPANNAVNFINAGPNLIVLPAPGTTSLTNAQLDAVAAGTVNGAQTLAAVRAAGVPVAYILDGRIQNLGGQEISGIDLNSRYSRDTSFGSIQASLNGTWKLKAKSRFLPGSPVLDNLAFGTSRFAMSAQLGATVGNFFAQATLQHQAGVRVAPSANRDPSQTEIPAFDVVNLAFRWNIENAGFALNDLVMSLNVTNVFDTPPPVNRTTAGSTINGFTLGRLVQMGVSMEF